MNSTEWTVVEVIKVTDGDTIRVVRTRPLNIDGKHYELTDGDPTGVAIRLVWVDTPERSKPGWAEAREDLRDWIDTAPRQLRVICYESGGWDRIMGDLIDEQGNSVSQWLMTERGWPPYTG